MAAGSTYTPIATTTLGSATANISFSSFTGYTDLVLVGSVNTSSEGGSVVMRFNSDSATNYSQTFMYGTGSSATSGRYTSGTGIPGLYIQGLAYGSPSAANLFMPTITNIMNYANSTTYKTVMTRATGNQTAGGDVEAIVGLWRSTSAITSILLYNNNSSNFSIGTTFTLYGIAAA
jgi:hypothetical protein